AGVGSLGNETSFFGLLTEKAVQRFQASKGIISSGSPGTTGYGFVGPKTRVALNAFCDGVSAGLAFTKDLAFGMRDAEVSTLQELLKRNIAIYPEGIVSGYFGNLTQEAVRKFQIKYGITTTGRIDAPTREKLNQIYWNNATP
ncbi:MAG TPA: peptidoglycan-binding domain-containing protein, partial [Candidatus Paceibacterota bacterium]